MKKVIFTIGAPGSGKTSTALELVKQLNTISHFSMGQIFRNEIASGSEVGKQIKQFLDKGITVPIQTAINALLSAIEYAQNDYVIIDGYPRDNEQLLKFNQLLKEQCNFEFVGLIEIEVSEQTARERILGRNRGEDDKESVFNDRMLYYHKYRDIIVESYEKEGLYFKINGNKEFRQAVSELSNQVTNLFKL